MIRQGDDAGRVGVESNCETVEILLLVVKIPAGRNMQTVSFAPGDCLF
jgi:hypothetical protein